ARHHPAGDRCADRRLPDAGFPNLPQRAGQARRGRARRRGVGAGRSRYQDPPPPPPENPPPPPEKPPPPPLDELSGATCEENPELKLPPSKDDEFQPPTNA